MFWQCGHTLPFSVPCDVSHKFPTFFDPVPNGLGPDAALMCTVSPSFWAWRFTAHLSKLLTHHHFAGADHFWHGCHTNVSSLPFKHGALPRGNLSSRHLWLDWDRNEEFFSLSAFREMVLPPLVGGLPHISPPQAEGSTERKFANMERRISRHTNKCASVEKKKTCPRKQRHFCLSSSL